MSTADTSSAAPARTGRRGQPSTLTGTTTLVRFALRRDRIRLPVWITAIAVSLVGTAASFPELYVEEADRQARAEIMSSPAAVAVAGPQIGLEDYTFGAMLTNEMLGLTGVAVALMSILLVVRHTRADEEAGRTELIRAGVTGRHAPLAAALTTAALANLALGLVTAVGLGSLGIEGIDWAGSWLFAAALASVGLVFAAVAAVTAQLSGNARGASGAAGLTLGIAFTLRAAGDVGADALAWASPIGWAQRTYAYVDDRWWPLLPALAVTVVLVVLAVALSSHRDVGAGLRPARPGPATASDRLVGPLRLAFRLQRAALAGWALAMLTFGALYGSLLGEAESFASELSAVEDMFAGLSAAMADAFLALLVSLLAMVAAIYAVLTTLRARTEETSGLAEPLLSTGVSRERWLAGHATMAAVGSTGLVLVGALGLGIAGAITLDDGAVLVTALTASSVYVAPLLLTVGLTVALFGLAPRASAAAWVVIVHALVAGMLGGLLGLPEWLIDLSPFVAVPMLPADDFVAGPVLVVGATAVVLLGAGFVGFRRRDLSSPA